MAGAVDVASPDRSSQSRGRTPIDCECGHAAKWRDVMLNMIRITKPGGLIMLTFAGRGRAAHGTIDSDAQYSPYTSDHYKNISGLDFLGAIPVDHFFSRWSIEADNAMGDTYFWGVRSHNAYEETTELKQLEYLLSKARGQLFQATQITKQKDAIIFDQSLQIEQSKSPIGYVLNKLIRKLRS